MKTKFQYLVIGLPFSFHALSYSQSGLAGTWEGREQQSGISIDVTVAFEVKGNILNGTRVAKFTGRRQECDLANGKVEGKWFSFECDLTGPDRGNPFTASFEGFINTKGDVIVLSPQKPASGGPVVLMRR